MSIEKAIFTAESIAHLQGKEAEILPIVDAARVELAKYRALRDAIGEFLNGHDRYEAQDIKKLWDAMNQNDPG